MEFGLYIIGDEILSGKQPDRHFARVTEILAARGRRLAWVSYLGDDRARLTESFRRSLTGNDVVFSCGGIGNTPDDHTRQAAAAAAGVALELHPDAAREIASRFKGEMTPERALLGTFPAGCEIIPNPFNRIPGFSVGQHHFVPGFPQMAWPMIEWVLDTRYAASFSLAPVVDRALLLTGEKAYESALLDLMETIVARFPDLRLFSLPSIGTDDRRGHLELGVEGSPERVDAALTEMIAEVTRRGVGWRWRDEPPAPEAASDPSPAR